MSSASVVSVVHTGHEWLRVIHSLMHDEQKLWPHLVMRQSVTGS